MTFKKSLAAVSFGLLFAAIAPAQAAVQNYTFSGSIDAGSLLGESYAGSFSFDDAALSGAGAEWLAVDSLSMNFMGSNFTQDDAVAPSIAEVGYYDGAFLGLSFSVDIAGEPFSFVTGSDDTSDAFFATDSSSGSLTYAAAVPEPKDWMLMLAGIGLVGVMVERAKRRSI
ncbi:PEP-CTERM sorting domain-containing protein [Sulfuriferula sp.]|uniref:PEP-CTERM sorting domain-containing protein n=1 Tax=Sulfuriferula sp. TaxID=2025307 RepID=UPI0027316569|nr:PEP-CTERM sorting domain-containing protein [Sulfuriferula sp.]MDP2025596.1 PEP-CTERM sorting domain-containing protein [Sulfuriferula sp.]